MTDHRIGFTLHQLEFVMDGKLDPIVDALVAHSRSTLGGDGAASGAVTK